MKVYQWITEKNPNLAITNGEQVFCEDETVKNFFIGVFTNFKTISTPEVMQSLYDFHIKQKLPMLEAYNEAITEKLFNLFGYTKEQRTILNSGQDVLSSEGTDRNSGQDEFVKNTDEIHSFGKRKTTNTDGSSQTTDYGKQHEINTDKAVAYNSFTEKEKGQAEKSSDAYQNKIQNAGSITSESDTYTDDVLHSGSDTTKYGKVLAKTLTNTTEYGKEVVETIIREGNTDPIEVIKSAIDILDNEYIIENILRNFADKYFYVIIFGGDEI